MRDEQKPTDVADPEGAPEPRTHPRRPSDARQALRAFATHGYDGVSVNALSRELGVSHNLLHQRFGSKLALWHAAVDWGFGEWRANRSRPSTRPRATRSSSCGIVLHRFLGSPPGAPNSSG